MAVVVDQLLFGLVHDFLKVYLPKQKCASPHTIKAYRTTLELLLDYVQQEKGIALAGITFEMLDSAMVNAFLVNLAHERQCSASTQNHRLACIRAFFKYAAMMEPAAAIHQREIQKVTPKRVAAQPPRFMSEAAVKALLEQPDTSTKLGVRDQFFMILLYDTAARIHIHPHLWRHSRAMHLYQHGMDLTLVSQWLDHVNLETTLIYAHADTEHKRRAIEKVYGCIHGTLSYGGR